MKTHGLSKTPIYMIWLNMKSRCNYTAARSYPRYGGRGITVCKKWDNSFEAFLEDMGHPPTAKHVLDRKNTNRGYVKSNCQWVTRPKNQQNMRTSKRWVLHGVEYPSSPVAAAALNTTAQTISAWCGGTTVRGKFYPAKFGCYSYKVYPDGDRK